MLPIKRMMDILGASVGLIAFAPLILGIAVATRWQLGSPIFFRQLRPGLHGKPFQLFKFRTMRDAVDADGHPLPDGDRLTPFGRWLRATSLDELPELWNVLKGDMSLVGPRPLLMEYLPLYTREQARRHEVKPGLTGWAQINGRNALTWEEKFAHDVWYVENNGLLLDLAILWRTVLIVFARDGISAPGEATMPKFAGSKQKPAVDV